VDQHLQRGLYARNARKKRTVKFCLRLLRQTEALPMSDLPEARTQDEGATHTPGPWFAVDRGRKGEPMMSVMAERIRGRGPSHEVCMCATGDSPQPMENANARLIAAAPDLLEALRDMVSDHPDQFGATVAFARAVIAKATGKL
jgi:hypothetical protein